MTNRARSIATLTAVIPLLRASVVALVITLGVAGARADDVATVMLTIKDHKFEPAEVHAPAGKPIVFQVKNLDNTAAEFESDALHVEKVITAGGEAAVHVRPQQPGRYKFFDDFHRQTQGFLVVP